MTPLELLTLTPPVDSVSDGVARIESVVIVQLPPLSVAAVAEKAGLGK